MTGKNGFKTLAWIILLACIQSCIKPEEFENVKVKYTPSVSIPLINSDLRIDEIVNDRKNDVNILVDQDGFITLEYFDEILSQSADERVSIPDQSLSFPSFNTIALPSIPGGPNTGFEFADSGNISLAVPNNAGFQEVTFKSGNLQVNLSSSMAVPHFVTFTLPGFLSNGAALSHQFSVPAGGGSLSHTFPLSGVVADFEENNQRNNFKYRVSISGTYNSSLGLSSGSVSAGLVVFGLPQYSNIKGYFGQFTIPINSSVVEINLFDNFKAGDLVVTNPSVDFFVRNSFGFPVEVLIDPLNVVSNELGTINVTGGFFGTPFLIAYPPLSRIGQFDTTRILVDNQNSNIVSVFSSAPRRVNYGLSLGTNEPNPNVTQFITDSSVIKVDAKVLLPAEGLIRIFTIADTFDIDITDLDEDNIQRAFMKIYMDNSFPLDVDVQLYFLDSGNLVFDSLLPNEARIIASGTINTEGRVIQSTIVNTDVEVDRARFKSLRRAKKVLAQGKLKTTNAGNSIIRIYTDNRLILRLGMQADLLFE